MVFKTYTRLLTMVASIAFLMMTVSSCKKEEGSSPVPVSLELPSTLTVAYGETAGIALPAELIKQSDVTFNFEFKETNNIQINNGTALHDKLKSAVKFDKAQGKVIIDSRLLYPNAAVSSVTGNKIPDNYKITVIASSSKGTVTGSQTVAVTVTPAKLKVKNADNTTDIPFAYVLYSKDVTNFELESTAIPTENIGWYLPKTADSESVVSMDGNKVKFAANAGDPKKEAEKAYDLEPALQKDGFTVASTKFRVIFIPQIKFFYGTYYPEYNLTILSNLVHIGLANGYLSSAPTLYPERYKSSFSIFSIEQDGKVYDNTDGIFELNKETGKVTVKQNTKLKAGRYKFMIKALTTTGLEFTSDLTLAMSAG
jgi:hypothetical protein